MRLGTINLKDILLKGNYVSKEDLEQADTLAKGEPDALVEHLLSKGLITKDLLGQAVAESFGVSYADLNSRPPGKGQVEQMPEEVGRKLRAVLFEEKEGGVVITTDNPLNAELVALKRVFPSKEIYISYSLPEDIDAVLLHYQKPLETRFSKIIAEKRRVAPELLEEIFRDAHGFRASDIHFEPQKNEVIIRFRVDGVLHEAGRLPHEQYENILNRIKVESNLRIDEHFAAQDGSLRYEGEGDLAFDLRTSIVPTVYGEKVVFRVLAAYVKGFALGELGLSETHAALIKAAADKPFGMLLVTGPTGSGKTTTLYGVLRILNTPDVNITTIEDPVEYKTPGVSQIQVNPATNLTFPKGLRSIVRQDPDIILVGEIRDEETAEIAVNAALTGHLLLSSFHANDAATAIPRLLDMGIEPFLLASTLELIVSQRLVRKICESCRYSVELSKEEWKALPEKVAAYFPSDGTRLYRGKGCADCGGTGYKGRTALFEFVDINPDMRNLILTHPSAHDVWKLAREHGAKSMFEDGVDKVKNGITTIDELMRVATPDEA